MAKSRICIVDGCGKPHASKGYCRSHYDRMRRSGSLEPSGITLANEARKFFYDVVLAHRDGCLFWPYAKDKNGYARINLEGHTVLAHRVVCRLFNGEPVPPRDKALHRCGRGHKGCVSPDCVHWGSDVDNQKDRVAHGTSNRGERQHSARLTENQIREIRSLKGEESAVSLANRYGVSKWTIFDILNRRNWAWLT